MRNYLTPGAQMSLGPTVVAICPKCRAGTKRPQIGCAQCGGTGTVTRGLGSLRETR